MKKLCLFAVVLLVVFSVVKIVSAKATCTILTKDLVFGDTNSSSGSQISALQSFLYSKGFLSVSPTGRFGSLTASAVKKFQLSEGISAIGSVGPITRSAIKKVSCYSVITGETSTSNTNVVTQPVATPVPVYNPIYTPASGAQLITGQKYFVQWEGGDNQVSVSLMLKDSNGAGAGHVASSLSGRTHSYNWTVGNVSLAGQQSVVIPPGDYQLNVIDDATYGSVFNIKSGMFSVKESPLFISHILPTQVPADGKTTVILYGSGFNSLTRVILSSLYNSTLTPQYVSPDGSFIWFYAPQYLSPGEYKVSVYNNYSNSYTSATSTPSNYVTLQVNRVSN